MEFPQLNRDDVIDAITEGVRQAFIDMVSNFGMKPVRDHVLDAIQEGVRLAILDNNAYEKGQ